MVAWRKEEDRAEENGHWKRAREGVERVFIAAPEANAEKLRRFRVTNDWFILRFSKTAPAVVVVVVFFTLIDRASTIPSNTRGCQSGTWSAGQKKIRGTSTKLQ